MVPRGCKLTEVSGFSKASCCDGVVLVQVTADVNGPTIYADIHLPSLVVLVPENTSESGAVALV